MYEQTLPRQAQVDLTLTMHDVGIHCVDMTSGLLRFQLHFTCSATLFLSFEVRECDSAVDFTSKKVVSVVAIFKIEVARDFYVTKQRICTSCGVTVVDFSGARRAPSTALRLLASPRGIKLSLRTCRSNSVSFHFTQTFLEKSLSSPIQPCSTALFDVRNRASPTSDCM